MSVPTPGEYGPVFEEPGIHETGGYFDSGPQVTVNHYGGNLIVSATDVEIASQGGFGLFFKRTYNSNRVFERDQNTLVREKKADSPLGYGWTAHYGILLPMDWDWQRLPRHQFVDSSGSRHLFYPHNHLTSQIPIKSSKGDHTWISSSLNLLTRVDDTVFEMLTPNGLKYRFEQYDPHHFYSSYYVPKLISDIHENSWKIDYESPGQGFYYEHPLVSSVTDDYGRMLVFEYAPVNIPEKKRLKKVKFQGTILAEYTYQTPSSQTRDFTHEFLKKHLPAENRNGTEYTIDQSTTTPDFGALSSIILPSKGKIEIGYEKLQIYYMQGQDPKEVYAVTSIKKGGYTWQYKYPDGYGDRPQDNRFEVIVKSTRGRETRFDGEYTYYTYGSPRLCNNQLWKVGLLIESEEKFNKTTRKETLSYRDFQVSGAAYTESCPANEVSAPRLLSSTIEQDGYSLRTEYTDHDLLNFPRRIMRPGKITKKIIYNHVTTSLKYILRIHSRKMSPKRYGSLK